MICKIFVMVVSFDSIKLLLSRILMCQVFCFIVLVMVEFFGDFGDMCGFYFVVFVDDCCVYLGLVFCEIGIGCRC